MPLPAGRETEEIAAREERTRTFGRKTEEGPDYVRIARQQQDNVKATMKPTHLLDMTYDLSVDRIQRIGTLLVRGKHVESFTMDETVAFIQLFGGQLQDKLNETLRTFIKEKMSK